MANQEDCRNVVMQPSRNEERADGGTVSDSLSLQRWEVGMVVWHLGMTYPDHARGWFELGFSF